MRFVGAPGAYVDFDFEIIFTIGSNKNSGCSLGNLDQMSRK